MNTQLDELINSLPKPTPQKVLRNEVDFYGLSTILAQKCDLPFTPRSFVATWKHGWAPQEMIKYPKQIVHWGGLRERHIVWTEKQKIFLDSHGYTDVHIAGAPFLYTPSNSKVTKFKNSVLIVPQHSLSYLDQDSSHDEFLDEAIEHSKNYQKALVLIHQETKNSKIFKKIKDSGISWVFGASAHDQNSLLRLNPIFSAFETMLTNSCGSHILYFINRGGIVKIMEPICGYDRKLISGSEWYLRNPDILEWVLTLDFPKIVRMNYPFLFNMNPEQQMAWANSELGINNIILDNKSVCNLLGWTSIKQLSGYGNLIRSKFERKLFQVINGQL